ncbi:TATA box-binding protein-associated factor, RNA polymerase I, subunit C isoform X2 [Dunckerocampus dactyliophorus]|uniref:TATA box-binding protein-associated factor, RNA polymerase I, subunit C isoform X2 n=1 Tax=Dunckerocampus dactyliophorus TaxID=161453 RepID=UPI002405035B|nr:TATA box-binding protein-associated factor, RNA polymerase I, subunit C isoform X2 [Dunckerocampus dactyliophorus]
MDYQFPRELFSSFYNCGPPDSTLKHCAGHWGSYDRVGLQGGSGPHSNCTGTFTSRHQVRGERWRHTEPVPIPLFNPKKSFLWPSAPPDPLDFTEHMQNFFIDHCQDAFGCMSEILGDHIYSKKGLKGNQQRHAGLPRKIKRFIDMLNLPVCHQSYSSRSVQAYSALLSDVLPDVPAELLGSLLYEELTEQRDSLLFSEAATGGALDFIPFSHCGDFQRGCLIYPGNQGRDRLNFRTVELEHHRDKCFSVNSSISEPFSFQLKGPIRQISSASLFNDCCVAVRSDHLCGVWRCSERDQPRLLQVVNTREAATCISVSPHVLGEVLVASESGTANLWTVGKGIQKVHKDDSNLYFNAKSSWRWCEFSAHPRVVLYADRTGAELCDIRVSPASIHTLFRISNTTQCRSGERLIFCRYLGSTHPFHHILTTQHSAYIMDERFPCLPMLKLDHMMQFPPMFCHVLPGVSSPGPTGGVCRTTKVVLGSQSSQEITLLQYSGGRAEACVRHGPPRALLRPCDGLKHLPVQIPHRMDTAANRLSSPAAGLTCIQKSEGNGASRECFCVLQLTEAGDVFYQILEHEGSDTSLAPATEDEPQPQQTAKVLPPQWTLDNGTESGRDSSSSHCLAQTDSQLVVPDTSSDEDVIRPTQGSTLPTLIPETPRSKLQDDASSETGSEELETQKKGQKLKRLNLHVRVNDDPAGEDRKKNKTDDPEHPAGNQETTSNLTSTVQQTSVKLSEAAVILWKRWLQKLMLISHKKKPRPQHPHHLTLNSCGLLCLSRDKMRELSEEAHVTNVRRQLRACMSNHSLLVRSTVPSDSTDILPFPDQVDTEAWKDGLSQRLTLSWQGEEMWRAWWEDRLGLNNDKKMDALRKKRRREREAKRAAGPRLDLSGSFTSSVSYQSDVDNFSDFTGWSSGVSQGARSDTEGTEMLSQSEDLVESGVPEGRTPTMLLTESTFPTPSATPPHGKNTQDNLGTPSSSKVYTELKTVQLEFTPSSQRRSKRPGDHYLSSLFGSQDGPPQHDNYFLDEGDQEQHSLPPLAHSSQRHSSQPLPPSQTSLGRPWSQPKKKKSRMGF